MMCTISGVLMMSTAAEEAEVRAAQSKTTSKSAFRQPQRDERRHENTVANLECVLKRPKHWKSWGEDFQRLQYSGAFGKAEFLLKKAYSGPGPPLRDSTPSAGAVREAAGPRAPGRRQRERAALPRGHAPLLRAGPVRATLECGGTLRRRGPKLDSCPPTDRWDPCRDSPVHRAGRVDQERGENRGPQKNDATHYVCTYCQKLSYTHYTCIRHSFSAPGAA